MKPKNLLNLRQGDIGLRFYLTCKKCQKVLGTTNKAGPSEVHCETCHEQNKPNYTPQEIEALTEKSRKAFTRRLFAQAGIKI